MPICPCGGETTEVDSVCTCDQEYYYNPETNSCKCLNYLSPTLVYEVFGCILCP